MKWENFLVPDEVDLCRLAIVLAMTPTQESEREVIAEYQKLGIRGAATTISGFGISGQTLESMKRDLELGLRYFERICVNIMCENSTPVRPDPDVIRAFCENLLPLYRSDQRVDILLNNTDFGVGD